MTLHALEHLLVLTDDLDATRDFYRDVLGLEEGARPPLPFPGCWMYARDAPCVHLADRAAYARHARTLGLAVAGTTAGTGAGAIDHIAFRATDYDATVERLERHGVHVVRNTVEGAGIRQLFVDDPNGVRVEINVLPEESPSGWPGRPPRPPRGGGGRDAAEAMARRGTAPRGRGP